MCGPVMYEMVVTAMGETMANRFLKGGFTVLSTHFIPVRPDSNPDDPKSMTVYIMGKPIVIKNENPIIDPILPDPNVVPFNNVMVSGTISNKAVEVKEVESKSVQRRKKASKKIEHDDEVIVPHNRPTGRIAGIREL